ncbi:hypothetical protein [Achromobacter spanius]|uniref:hypothetical protein n=1 Tax=Achromobacter spanius TaxID=217203 RepID=UPI0037FD62A6
MNEWLVAVTANLKRAAGIRGARVYRPVRDVVTKNFMPARAFFGPDISRLRFPLRTLFNEALQVLPDLIK